MFYSITVVNYKLIRRTKVKVLKTKGYNMNTNIINATVNCDCFIVPNKAAIADLDYTMGQNLAAKAAEIAAENGFSYDKSVDKFVQM